MDGILLVDKPAGWTSHDVVAKVRGLLRQRVDSKGLKTKNYKLKTPKVGHAGTLDPMATGLLIILIGGYTKRASQYLKLDKTYDCELTLGKISTTGDADGRISHVSDKVPSEEQVREVVEKSIGTTKQIPPAYSAIKIKGQAAYKLARAGKELKMEPRVVTIYQLQTTNYQYPKLNFTARVSSGTYIRSLAQDIGARLGTGAYLSALRRTQIGQFDIKGAVGLDVLSPKSITKYIQT